MYKPIFVKKELGTGPSSSSHSIRSAVNYRDGSILKSIFFSESFFMSWVFRNIEALVKIPPFVSAKIFDLSLINVSTQEIKIFEVQSYPISGPLTEAIFVILFPSVSEPQARNLISKLEFWTASIDGPAREKPSKWKYFCKLDKKFLSKWKFCQNSKNQSTND